MKKTYLKPEIRVKQMIEGTVLLVGSLTSVGTDLEDTFIYGGGSTTEGY